MVGVTNKFNLEWQLKRLSAKKEKDVQSKVDLVAEYAFKDFIIKDGIKVYSKNRIIRSLNWARTTKMAYHKRNQLAVDIFNCFIDTLNNKSISLLKDDDIDICSIDKKEIISLLKDLERRKYGFMFNGIKPKDHNNFINKLKKYVDNEIS